MANTQTEDAQTAAARLRAEAEQLKRQAAQMIADAEAAERRAAEARQRERVANEKLVRYDFADMLHGVLCGSGNDDLRQVAAFLWSAYVEAKHGAVVKSEDEIKRLTSRIDSAQRDGIGRYAKSKLVEQLRSEKKKLADLRSLLDGIEVWNEHATIADGAHG